MQIILADNQAIFRAGMFRFFASEPQMSIVAQCGDLDQLKEAIVSRRRSIVIMPLGMTTDVHPILDLIEEAASRIVLLLDQTATLEDAVRQRVQGVLLRSVAARQLVECLYRVAAGERCVQRAVIRATPTPDPTGTRLVQRLTPKELQIVALIAEGCRNKAIAERLGTKEQVVKNYLRNIYDKAGVSDRLELALFTVHHHVLAEAVASVKTVLAQTVCSSGKPMLEA